MIFLFHHIRLVCALLIHMQDSADEKQCEFSDLYHAAADN